MKYDVYNQTGEKVKEIELNSKIFGVSVKEELVHQVLVAQDANRRQAVAHTQTRAEKRGGGRKPFRQKGTGRARAGSRRSPLWRGGGVIFGPRNDRNFSKNINKKMKRKALFMALSDKVADEHMILLDNLTLNEVKTKKFVEAMTTLFEVLNGSSSPLDQRGTPPRRDVGAPDAARGDIPSPKRFENQKILFVTPETDDNLILSSRNIKKVKVIRADSLNVRDVLDYPWLVMPVGSLEVIESTYLRTNSNE